MLRYFHIICATLICLSLQSRAAVEATTAPQISNLLSYVTTVHDMAKLDFAAMTQKDDTLWIEAMIKPNKWSGAVKIGRSYLDADTGKVVKNPNGHDVIRVNGTFHILAVLTGKPEKVDYTYQWEFPFSWASRRNSPDPAAPFKVFIDGGSAIFPITNDLKDPKKVLPIYPIPAEWQEFVVPAWKYYQENSAIFQPPDAAKNQVKLRQLLEQDNPFIAIAACCTLANEHLLDKAFAEGPLKNATELRQAVFTFLFLGQSPVKAEDGKSIQGSVEAINQLIDESNSASKLRGVAVGALTGLRELDDSGSVRSFKVLDALDKKQDALHANADGFVASVIKNAALPILRQNFRY
ncbi:MAG: hypothetical protein ABI210_10510 [Abditibacteriaceae bacterium]